MHGHSWHRIGMATGIFSGLLRRPLTARPALAPASPKRGATPAVDPLPDSEQQPITVAELTEAIDTCFREKQKNEIFLEEVVFRQEELLADDDVPAETLVQLEADAQNASREITRWDVRSEKLAIRLRDLKRVQQSAAFAAHRDVMVEAARALLPAFRAAADAAAVWHEHQIATCRAFPGAAEFIPGLISVTHTDVDHFQRATDRLAQVVLGERPAISIRTAADQIKAVMQGTIPAPGWGNLGGFSETIAQGLAEPRDVILVRSTYDADGRRVKAGAELSLPFEQGRDLVASGKAKWKMPL